MLRICQFFTVFLLLAPAASAAESTLEDASDQFNAKQTDPIPLFSMTEDAIKFVVQVMFDCTDPATESALTMMIADTFVAETVAISDGQAQSFNIEVPSAQLQGLQAKTLCQRSEKANRLTLNDAFSVQISAVCMDAPRNGKLISLPLSVEIDCEAERPMPDSETTELIESQPTASADAD